MAEVINSLPYGENTAVFKQFREGQDPATGQRPHIGVARGIFRDAAVLVADEPTAALDVRTEPARSPA